MTNPARPSAPSPQDAVRIRTRPPQPLRLSRKVLMTGVCAAGAIVAIALLTGLSTSNRRSLARLEDAPASIPAAPEALQALPARYGTAQLQAPQDADPIDRLWGDHKPPEAEDDLTLAPPDDAFWAEPSAPSASSEYSSRRTSPSSANNVAAADPAPAPLFFEPRRDGAHTTDLASSSPGTIRETAQVIEGGGRREGFLARQRASADSVDTPYLPPRSPFELQAGAVIPAALVTALNSDLPGRVIAQVTAPVYDSVSGDHLLIPQGARLIGTYDSANAYGDTRAFLVWNRILMPNGWSLQLQGMEATDPTGAAGLAAHTDNHLARLGGAIGLSAVLSILGNEAEDTSNAGDPRSFGRSIGDAAAQEAARVGGRIIDRQLNLRPTLRVRPGAPVRVLVTRDIELRPYRE